MGTHCYTCPRKSGFKCSASRHFSLSAAWLKGDCPVRNWGYLSGVSTASDAVLCRKWLPKRALLDPAGECCGIVRNVGNCSPNDALSPPWRLALSVVILVLLAASGYWSASYRGASGLIPRQSVWDLHKDPKYIVAVDALALTIPHTPDSQHHWFERFQLF